MISLYEMFIATWSNWGEKTPRSSFNTFGTGDWSIMKDSNLIVRGEGIDIFNSENTAAKLANAENIKTHP